MDIASLRRGANERAESNRQRVGRDAQLVNCLQIGCYCDQRWDSLLVATTFASSSRVLVGMPSMHGAHHAMACVQFDVRQLDGLLLALF